MKIPAIRAKIGIWEYYVTTLTFEQVSTYISKIDDQLHQSQGLKDLIQRSITDNYLSIKEYILNQPEVFFNSLVLAVYDRYPNWREITFKYDDLETYQMGLLEFQEEHKIFPVDGQHRVEGIKEALKANPDLKDQKITAIFIGHKNDDEGKKRTRRLFTTLNRYAKPVKDDDIIALDEDDMAAIVTRNLLEEYSLFTGNRVIYAKQKAIPPSNKHAITSIITLYQANVQLLKYFIFKRDGKKPTKKRLETVLKFRPTEDLLKEFESFVIHFWNAFTQKMEIITLYLNSKELTESLRNNETGGNLIFRPIGFLPIVKATINIKERTGKEFSDIFERFNTIDFNINSKPWQYVVWNPVERKMIMSSDSITENLLIFLYDKYLLSAVETRKLSKGYAAKLSIEDQENINNILEMI